MGARTGRPRGRPKGTRNQRTIESLKAMAEMAEMVTEALPSAFDGDAHAFLMATYKNETLPYQMRLQAASVAINFEKARLAAVKHSGDEAQPVAMTITHADADTFASRVSSLLTRSDT